MKYGIAIAALSMASFAEAWTAQDLISDILGNQGIGHNNDYSGERNRWIGDDNKIHGEDNLLQGDKNTILGRDNIILGSINNIQGAENQIIGENNKVTGKGNIIQGAGNIISNDLNDIPFDIESRLPAWMRTNKNSEDNDKTKKAQRPATPEKSFSPRKTIQRTNEQFQDIQKISSENDSYKNRKPSFREVIHSPGKTQVREIYLNPDLKQQSKREFSPRSNSKYEKFNSWKSQSDNWSNAWNIAGGVDSWKERIRQQTQKQAQELRSKIQFEVRQQLNRVFRNNLF